MYDFFLYIRQICAFIRQNSISNIVETADLIYKDQLAFYNKQLAEKAGISPGYLAHLEALRSDAEPSYEMLSRLACALGVTISELTAVDLELIR